MNNPWSRWLNQMRQTPGRKAGRKPRRTLLNLEALETRYLLSTFTVTTNADTNAVNPAVSPLDGSGNISIRSAIEAFNANPGTNDMIIVPAGLYQLSTTGGTGQGTTAALLVTDSVTIQGAGAASTLIDAQQLDRVLDITSSSANVTLQGLTIENGVAPVGAVGNAGTHDAAGGGILDEANTLTLLGCVVANNTAIGQTASPSTSFNDGAGYGGGIYETNGTLTSIDTTISNNKAYGGAGSIFTSGAGGFGGGIYDFAATLLIQSSAVTGNQAGGGASDGGSGGVGEGGGVCTFPDKGSQLTVSDSTFSGNTAVGGLGGAEGGGGPGLGGGIFNAGNNNGGTLVPGSHALITNTTIANNQANGGSNNEGGRVGNGQGGGLYNDYGGTASIGSTIIALNSVSGNLGKIGTDLFDNDIPATTPVGITSMGFNLIGNDDQPTNEFNGPHDQVGAPGMTIDPLLGPLHNNGGLTDTLALMPGSPAIDQGNKFSGAIPGSQYNPLQFDQREANALRTVDLPPANVGDGTDIGAFELQKPTLTTIPNVSTVTLGSSSVILKDTAALVGGFNPTGTITFTLFLGGTLVDTETATVSGNGNYTTPTGYTLPTSGTVTGAYQWDATYGGDVSNVGVSDNNNANEQVVVNPANPTVTTTPNLTNVTLGSSSVTLKDTAALVGGFNPTGTITFTLFLGGVLVDTETATVSGNGNYTTPTGYTLPTSGTVTGPYQWDAIYRGDANNKTFIDNNNANEQVMVDPASPTITTTPNVTTVMLGSSPVTLKDTAALVGGFNPTGTITFTLFQGGTLVDTETATVSGNGNYTTPTGYTLPTSGTVTGAYQWDATYGGDVSNVGVSDNNNANEQVVVSSSALPIITTTFASKVQLLGSNNLGSGVTGATQDADTLFVNGLYQKLLGRAPDQDGVNGWVFLLESGVSRLTVVDDIWRSPEHRGLQVDQYYQQYLHRAADPTGRAGFVNAFLAGASEIDVQTFILTSPEYLNAHVSDSAFVTGLYADVLGRAPDAAGLAGFLQVIQNGASRASVARAFLTAPETNTLVATSYYVSFLRRAPSAGEAQSLATLLGSGQVSQMQVGEAILASDEFFAKPV